MRTREACLPSYAKRLHPPKTDTLQTGHVHQPRQDPARHHPPDSKRMTDPILVLR